MSDAVVAEAEGPAVPIQLVTAAEAEAAIAVLPAPLRAQAEVARFRAKAGEVAALADETGLARVLAGLGDGAGAMALRGLPSKLAPGFYALSPREGGPAPADIAAAFAIGSYRFDRY